VKRERLKIIVIIAVMFSVCAVGIIVLNEYVAPAYEIPPTTGESGHNDLIPLLLVSVPIIVIGAGIIFALVIIYLILRRLPTPPDGCGDGVYSEYG
jgi:hypothetical protein